MLRSKMAVFAVAFALSVPSLVTNAVAAGSSFGGGHIARGAKAVHQGSRVLSGNDYETRAWSRRSYEWDPWGHWGAYYGPNPAPL
jgi:hypothetical protein